MKHYGLQVAIVDGDSVVIKRKVEPIGEGENRKTLSEEVSVKFHGEGMVPTVKIDRQEYEV